MTRYKELILCIGLVLSLASGCTKDQKSGSAKEGESCQQKDDCVQGLVYLNGSCQPDKTPSKDQDTKTDQGPDGKTDADTDNCEKNYYGPDCEPCLCVDGTCDDGKKGTGACTCSEGTHYQGDLCDIADGCQKGWTGDSCNIIVTCLHGTVNEIDGTCEKCTAGTAWEGENCDVCGNNFTGDACTECASTLKTSENCDVTITCVNGVANQVTGACASCTGDYWGENCASNVLDCLNGTAKLGVNGDGKCARCLHGYDLATNCEERLADYMDAMTDGRGNLYKVTTIGGQIWMAENMASDMGTDQATVECLANEDGGSDFVERFGCLYSWDDAQKICPAGWRLPSEEEFTYLERVSSAYNEYEQNIFLRAESWVFNNLPGADKIGFAALPSGRILNGNFNWENYETEFWGIRKESDGNITPVYLYIASTSVYTTIRLSQEDYFAVRCVEEACASGYFGEDCEPCTCENGFCNDGIEGDGHCSECMPGYWGADCQSNAPIVCEHGTASLGSCDQLHHLQGGL